MIIDKIYPEVLNGRFEVDMLFTGDFAIKRDIRIRRMNPEVFEVLEGLETGEKVITCSYDAYGDIDKLILKQ